MGDKDERMTSSVEMENNHSLDTRRYFSRDFLKRFMGNSEKSELEDIDEDEETELELNLGLSLGGRFGIDKTSTKLLVRSSSIATILPTVRDDDIDAVATTSPPVLSYNNSSSSVRTSLPVETEAEWRKRKELQSLRRMQAKKRRSEKQRNVLKGTTDNNKCHVENENGGIEMNLGCKWEKEKYLANAKKYGLLVVPPLPILASFGSGNIDFAIVKGKGNNYLGSKMQGLIGKPAAAQGSMESQGGTSSSISELETKSAPGSAEACPPSIQSLQEGRS